MMRRIWVGILCAIAVAACVWHRSDEVDVSQLPQEQRADYAVFAQRCSKCHSLARPLTANVTGDEHWVRYVERMRRQPASGIAPEDVPPILRFLHYYTETKNKK